MKTEYKHNKYFEYTRRTNIQNGWKISLKYSQILVDNISNINLSDTIYSIYGEFLIELKSNKLRTDTKMKYIRCWDTMMNTNYNQKSEQIIRNAIKQLHYTSHINVKI